MSHNVGADELRIRGSLRRLIDGPAATPPPMPPGPPPPGFGARPRDWLDNILDSNAATPTPKPAEEPPAERPEPSSGPTPIAAVKPPKRRKRKPSPDTPRTAFDTRPPAPRQSLLDAWQRIPHRVKWLGYHATAALAGWRLGWVDWGTDTAAWYADGHWLSPSAIALYALGALVIAVYRRSRHWAWPVAWAAAIPVSSVVAGVLLYGTGYQP